jgi:RNA polymerase sigma-70 factor (ECF subfamily)
MKPLADSSDTDLLLTRAAHGDEAAIERLFAQHLPGIKLSIERRLRPQVQPRFDASDIVQETHHVARRQLADYLQRRPMPFGLWLFKTAHQRLIDYERAHLRSARRTVERELPLPDESSMAVAELLIDTRSSPSDVAVRREQGRVVRRCLAQLADIDREILLLRIFEGMTNAQVAALLELPGETTKKRFTRALLRAKQLLRQAGFDEGPSR